MCTFIMSIYLCSLVCLNDMGFFQVLVNYKQRTKICLHKFCFCLLVNKSIHIQTINLDITDTKTVQKKNQTALNIDCFDDRFSLFFSG